MRIPSLAVFRNAGVSAPASWSKSALEVSISPRLANRRLMVSIYERLPGSAPAQKRQNAEQRENGCRHEMHHPDWQEPGDSFAKPDRRGIGQHHAQRGARRDHRDSLILRAQGNRGDLGLVAHLDEKERNQRGQEGVAALADIALGIVQLVRHQGPGGHGDEGNAQHPAQHVRAQHCCDPCPQGASQRVVGDEVVAAIDLKADRQSQDLLIQKWTWVGRGRARAHKRLVEEELGRFETWQVG